MGADDGRDPAPYRQVPSALDESASTSRPAGAEEEAMAVITIQGLTKRFGQVVTVDNLSS